jgi:hypothetical protein
MSSNLRLDWCSHDAAKFAVENWHYSGTMPAGKNVKIGVWEDGEYIGAVIYGTGAAPQAACPFGIGRQEVCELVRVALTRHDTPVTRIVSIAMKMLRNKCPGLRLVISYADPDQDHYGVIYQAGNWIYLGETKPCTHYILKSTGKMIHSKTLATGRRGYVSRLLQDGRITPIKKVKRKYVFPFDFEMRGKVQELSQPYPKRAGSADSGTLGDQSRGGGASPTSALS